jgi:hypothetical protein
VSAEAALTERHGPHFGRIRLLAASEDRDGTGLSTVITGLVWPDDRPTRAHDSRPGIDPVRADPWGAPKYDDARPSSQNAAVGAGWFQCIGPEISTDARPVATSNTSATSIGIS